MDTPEKLRVDALNAMHGAAIAEGEGVWKELVMALLSPEWPDEYAPDEYATERQEVLSAQVWISVLRYLACSITEMKERAGRSR